MPQATRLVLLLVGMLAFKGLGGGGEPEVPKAPVEVTRHKWGQYRIIFEKVTGGSIERGESFDQHGFFDRVLIQDKRGRTVREIRVKGELLHEINEVKFVELTGGGLPELFISAYAGGLHCCFIYYYFTQDGGLQNLLIFDGNEFKAPEPRDLNGDGRPELVGYSDVLAYFEELCHACSPSVQMVIGWDGKAYRDQTKAYPQLARKLAQEYQTRFLKFLSDPDLREGEIPGYQAGAALGYYANSMVIGEEAGVRAWLLQHAPKEILQWLFDHEEALRSHLAQSARKIRVSQKRLLTAFE